LTILLGDVAVVRAAARRFKQHTLYAKYQIFLDDFPTDLAAIGPAFESLAARYVREQLFFAANDDFCFVTRLPVEPFGRWPKPARIGEALALGRHLILCLLANKQGDELQLVVPRSLDPDAMVQVLERFIVAACDKRTWTNEPPHGQHSGDLGWPRLWFYENQEPTR
jgi:hypothetical protein